MSEENTGAYASTESNTPEESAETVIQSLTPEESSEDLQEDSIDAAEATDSELAEVLESDEATEEEQAEAKVELKRRMKFKVNGREVERDIDLSDEEGLQELLQKGFAADERFQSASALEKKMQEFAALMEGDPIQALIAAGHDPDKLTEAYMEKRVNELSKSPEQLQLEKLQQEIEKERKLREGLEQEKISAEQSKIEAEYSRQLDEEITDSLSSSDLPKSPYVVKRIAENLMLGIQQGYEDISVQDVLPLVERQIKDEIRQMFEAMPEDLIEKTLGSDVSTKLRKRRLSKMKKAPETATSVKATGKSEMKKTEVTEEVKRIKAKDFFKNF